MIAFYALDSKEVFVIPAEGGKIQRIAPGVSPDWSPDGQRLLFTDGGRLWSFRADGTDSLLLFESSSYVTDYSWSPNGDRVLFESQSHIYVINADGGELREVAYPAENPVWWERAESIARQEGYRLVTLEQLRSLYRSDKKFLIVDVRPDYQFRGGHLPRAVQLEFDPGDRYQLKPGKRNRFADLLGPDKSRKIIIYCQNHD